VYEIETAAKVFRRVSGNGPAHREQWRQYVDVYGPEVGKRCLISQMGDWDTLTTEVVEVS